MGEMKNLYPRLCRGCLKIIRSAGEDTALLDYGGHHRTCKEETPELSSLLQGQPELLNDILQRDELLRRWAFFHETEDTSNDH